MNGALPWQRDLSARVDTLRGQGRLPHALLLRGPKGVGKESFARRLLNSILCESDSASTPCGDCRGCRLVQANSHPDAVIVIPPQDKTRIGIAQIREMIGTLSLTAQYAGYKGVLICPAEAMTFEATNTLLKTLEEPPGQVLFLLVSHQPSLLPATIRSRCQALGFVTPQASQSLAWLETQGIDADRGEALLALCHGAPMAAYELSDTGSLEAHQQLLQDLTSLIAGGDPVKIAAAWATLGLQTVGYWLTGITARIIRLKLGAIDAVEVEGHRAVQDLGGKLDLISLFRLHDRSLDARFAAIRQLNLNEQLMLEELAMAWHRVGQNR